MKQAVSRDLTATDACAVIVHGGAAGPAGESRDAERVANLRAARDRAWEVVSSGARGEEAVVAGLRELEGAAVFNAGYGSHPNEDGEVLMDVGLMCGDGRFSALMNVGCVKYPSSLVLRDLDLGFVGMRVCTERIKTEILSAPAAERAMWGVVDRNEDLLTPDTRALFERFKNGELSSPSQPPQSRGTVGCVVRDRHGRLFAGTSTGGLVGKRHGRVGDSPIVGAGVYARDGLAGLSATGWGEFILSSRVSGEVLSRCRSMQRGDPAIFESDRAVLQQVMREELAEMTALNSDASAGLIIVPARGLPAYAFNSARLFVAFRAYSSEGGVVEDARVAG